MVCERSCSLFGDIPVYILGLKFCVCSINTCLIINKKSLHGEVLLVSILTLVSKFIDLRKRHAKIAMERIEQNLTNINGLENCLFYSI